jgi:hypothetical protein
MNNSVVPEPEGSSSHSQQLSNDPYPEPVESNLHLPANLNNEWMNQWIISSFVHRYYCNVG